MRSHRRATPLAVVILALACASSADAAITGSNVTDPADPFAGVWDFTGGQGPYSLRVAGTTTGGSTNETVSIRCDDGAGSVTLATNVPVDSTARTFATFVFVDQFARPCRLRAVPTGVAPTIVTTFTGPRVYPSALLDRRVGSASPNSGVRHGFLDHSVTPDRTTHVAIDALGGCGVFDARPLDPAGDPTAPALDAFSCAGFADDKADGSGSTRSDILVDGRHAFTGGVQFYSPFVDQPGMPELAHAATLDRATGEMHVDESSAVVRCANVLITYPPADASACGGMTDTHVKYSRTTTTTQGNRVVTVTDRWESTDGQPHDLDLLLEIDLASNGYGLQVPWFASDFRRFPGNASLPGAASAPGSIFVESDANVPAGSVTAPVGAVVFATAPSSVEFFDAGGPVSRYPQVHYVRSIPASGPLTIAHTYVFGSNMDEVRALAATAEDAYGSPSVTIVAPHDGARTRHTKITVTGTASDNRAVASVAVGGMPATLAPDGTWAATVKLRRGINRLVAEARDTQGNASQAAVTVVMDPRPACVVPRLLGLTIRRATHRLAGRRCVLGAVTQTPQRGYSQRRGKRRVFVRVARGRIVGQRPKVGARVDAGTAVSVQVRSRR